MVLYFVQDFVLNVTRVYKNNGFVFHDGYVEEGCAKPNIVVEVVVNEVSYSLQFIVIVLN